MGIDAALADQPQVLQPIQERRLDFGPLADENQDLGVPQPLSQPSVSCRWSFHMVTS